MVGASLQWKLDVKRQRYACLAVALSNQHCLRSSSWTVFDDHELVRQFGHERRWEPLPVAQPQPALQYRHSGKRCIRYVNIFDFDGTLVCLTTCSR